MTAPTKATTISFREDEPADHGADKPDGDVAKETQLAAAYHHAGQQTGDQADHQPGDDVVPADPGKREHVHVGLPWWQVERDPLAS